MTDEQKQNYLDIDGVCCPYCDSEDIKPFSAQSHDLGEIHQRVECQNCFEEWTDVYTLTGVE